jgi:hypothetical protein
VARQGYSAIAMRASGGFPSDFSYLSRQLVWASRWLAAGALGACTLITDVDREDIPEPQQPTFPEIDAGPLPTDPAPDASTPDASPDASPPEPTDAGDADAAPVDAAAPSDAG